MSPRLAFALETAYKAGRLTLGHFQNGVAVELKEDNSPVTLADREAEALIRREIERQYPREAILGEEQGGTGEGNDRWVIDPIDGTKSFICGVPLYATLLSYERAGQPEIGVCYFPALDEMLFAEIDGGAFFNGRPSRVSSRSSIGESVVCSAGFSSFLQTSRIEGLARIARSARATRTWSDAYGHALVATGRVEAMLDPIVSRWDLSAMALIVREAGGKFTGFDGRDGIFNEAVSSNGALHSTILEAFSA